MFSSNQVRADNDRRAKNIAAATAAMARPGSGTRAIFP